MLRHWLLCFVLMTIISVIPNPSAAQERDSRVRADGLRTISVVGIAEESMTPDLAELTVGVETRRRNASECLEINARHVTELMDVLKRQGIDTKDIQTSQIDLGPTYDRPKSETSQDRPAAKILGYQVRNKVVITIRDPKKVGELLDLIVKAGVNQIDGLSFIVSNKKQVLRGLRKRALADAREKAEEAAKNVGMVCGNPVSIHIDDTSDDRGIGLMGSGALVDAQLSAPIAMGQEVVRVSVDAVYELKLPQ